MTEKILAKAAAVAVPTIVTKFGMKMSGLHGAPAFNTTVKSLGNGNMYKGVIGLGVIGLITNSTFEWGTQKVSILIVKQLYRQREPMNIILHKIDIAPISCSLKAISQEELYDLDRKEQNDEKDK
ncbi:MAG: hypothetical protein SPL89_05225 [Clostridia bacterium]|nr:hypothetical protein [Clostridia bacterium]